MVLFSLSIILYSLFDGFFFDFESGDLFFLPASLPGTPFRIEHVVDDFERALEVNLGYGLGLEEDMGYDANVNAQHAESFLAPIPRERIMFQEQTEGVFDFLVRHVMDVFGVESIPTCVAL